MNRSSLATLPDGRHHTSPRCRSLGLALLVSIAGFAAEAHAFQPATPTAPAPAPAAPSQPAPNKDEAPAPLTGIAAIKRDAQAVLPTVKTDLARAFLTATENLPAVEERTIFRHKTTRAVYTPLQADALPDDQKSDLEARPLGEQFYYTTRYGSPVAYARAIDVLAEAGFKATSPEAPFAGKRIMDFGYGGIGQLRAFGLMGGHAVGVDVDPLLPVLYHLPTDTGPIGSHNGTVKIVNGQWPMDAKIAEEVGTGYDLILSKNTLKRGYIHPEREADKRMLIDLGVDDATYVKALHDSLKPGGYVMIYNLCPAQAPADKPYIPWADGRCPFEKSLLEQTGFEVVAYDVVDDEPMRELGRALGWADMGMKLETDLFAWYTVLRRR
jgi:hypothetical protein